jgi:hypothetical protein
MLQRPGEPAIQLSQNDVVNIMQQQQQHIVDLTNRIQELEKMVVQLQVQLIEKGQNVNLTNSPPKNSAVVENKIIDGEEVSTKIIEKESNKCNPLVTVEAD